MKKLFFHFVVIISLLFLSSCIQEEKDPAVSKNVFPETSENTEIYDKKISVSFINPGVSDRSDPTGAFWFSVSSFMKAAADDLNIDLEILYAEREYANMVSHVKDVCSRPVKPDYLIIVNENLAAKKLLEIAEDSGIDIFLMLNDLTDEQKGNKMGPRRSPVNWKGTLTPDNIKAGSLIAEEVINAAEAAGKKQLEMAAISGNRVTPASVERKKGLSRVLESNKNITLHQTTYGEWREDIANIQAKVLLKRYPEINIFWTANDPMALGAARAVRELGMTPGKDVFVAGLNWSEPALESVKNNEMAATIGGHFTAGGWTLVVIYDHYNGIDFKESEGLNMTLDIFDVINPSNIDLYFDQIINEKWDDIDFRRFTKKHGRDVTSYAFDLTPVFDLEN